MVKINEVDLKGFKLFLVSPDGKKQYPIATLDSVEPVVAKGEVVKNALKLHLVQGTKWSGDIVADMPEGRVLCIKGSIFSRTSAVKEEVATKVGQVG